MRNDIGHKIRSLREEQNIDQVTLADMVGVTQSFISRVENGKDMPSIKTLRKIAKALGVVNSNYFFEEPNENNIPIRRIVKKNMDNQDYKEFEGYISVLKPYADDLTPDELKTILKIYKKGRK